MSERTWHTDLEDCDDCTEKNDRIRALEAENAELRTSNERFHHQAIERSTRAEKAEAALAAARDRARAAEISATKADDQLNRLRKVLAAARANVAYAERHDAEDHECSALHWFRFQPPGGRESGDDMGARAQLSAAANPPGLVLDHSNTQQRGRRSEDTR